MQNPGHRGPEEAEELFIDLEERIRRRAEQLKKEEDWRPGPPLTCHPPPAPHTAFFCVKKVCSCFFYYK